MDKTSKKPAAVYGDMVRSACTAYFRSLGLTGEQIQKIADDLKVSKSTIEGVIYKEKGGLDTYAAVFAKIHKIEKNNIRNSLFSFLEHLNSSKPRKSYLKWQKIASSLTENRRLFWLSILEAAIDAERRFRSK